MSRPVVLVVEPRSEMRRVLSHGLAEFGYEVVPVLDAAQAGRFAEALDTWMIVAAGELFTDLEQDPAPLIDLGRRVKIPLLLVGEPLADESGLPDDVLYVSRADLDDEVLVRRLHLVLLGRELGLDSNLRAESLVGDLSRKPFFELLPALAATGFTGQLQWRHGSVALAGGEVVAARTRRARGLKAFCRLARHTQGAFRVLADSTKIRRDIELDFDSLLARAVEDSLVPLPDLQCRVAARGDQESAQAALDSAQMEIMVALHAVSKVGDLFDALGETYGRLSGALQRLVAAGLVELRDPEPEIAVVTDSTADLPAELAAQHHIYVVPLTVHFGDRVYRDGVDLSSEEFYDLLRSSEHHPFTRPPSAETFQEVYDRLTPGKRVVSLHISAKLSDTVKHAWLAAKGLLPSSSNGSARPPVQAIDSTQVTLSLGLQSLFAARMVERGLTLAEVAERLKSFGPRMPTLFVVDTLEYLVKGGRIGRARAMVGKLLGIKPVLAVDEGEIVALDRGRGNRAAIDRLMVRLDERLDRSRPTVVGVAHASAPAWADLLRERVEERYQVSELIVSEIGPVVGAHVGPGTVGAAVFQPADDELELVAPLR